MQTTFTIHEASDLTGASIRQIDHLVAKGLVAPTQAAARRGMSRVFDFQGVFEIALARLLVRRLTPAEMRIAIHTVRERWAVLMDPNTRDRYAILRLTEVPYEQLAALQVEGFDITPDLVSIDRVRKTLFDSSSSDYSDQVLHVNIGRILATLTSK